MTTAAIASSSVPMPLRGYPAPEYGGEQQSGEAAAHAADDVDDDLGARDVQAHEARRLLAAADRVDGPAEAGPLHDDGSERDDEQGDDARSA